MSKSSDRFEPPTSADPPSIDASLNGAPSLRPLATRTSRLAAAMLDSLLYSLLLFPVMQKLGLLDDPESWRSRMSAILLGVVGLLIINGFLLATRGQSVGKWLLGIRIVGLDGRLLPLSRILFLRYLPVQLLAQVPLVGIGMAVLNVSMIFRKDSRCGHDHIAGTVVVVA